MINVISPEIFVICKNHHVRDYQTRVIRDQFGEIAEICLDFKDDDGHPDSVCLLLGPELPYSTGYIMETRLVMPLKNVTVILINPN